MPRAWYAVGAHGRVLDDKNVGLVHGLEALPSDARGLDDLLPRRLLDEVARGELELVLVLQLQSRARLLRRARHLPVDAAPLRRRRPALRWWPIKIRKGTAACG